MRTVLLVEDEMAKAEDIQGFLHVRFDECIVEIARSVRSAVDALRGKTVFDLVILDMSLPTFDITDLESGGSPKGFGGVEVLKYLQKVENNTPTIVVTAFEAFSQGAIVVNLDEMRQRLAIEFPQAFRGAVYYNVMFNTWATELESCIELIGWRRKC